MTTSQENLGIGIELSAIAAAIVGGVSLQGGIGDAIGPVIGAFLMGVILIGLNLVGVTTYAQPVLTGLILLGAVAYDRWQVLTGPLSRPGRSMIGDVLLRATGLTKTYGSLVALAMPR